MPALRRRRASGGLRKVHVDRGTSNGLIDNAPPRRIISSLVATAIFRLLDHSTLTRAPYIFLAFLLSPLQHVRQTNALES
jgi:hypothetical protein